MNGDLKIGDFEPVDLLLSTFYSSFIIPNSSFIDLLTWNLEFKLLEFELRSRYNCAF
jgi:hypothetical protein